MRTLLAASILSLMIGAGPALAQATPPLNSPPTEPGDMGTKKKAVKKTKTSKSKKSSSSAQ
jgi:hypothetical protein